MAALLYFDKMQNVNVKLGLNFFARCSLACALIFTFQSVKKSVHAQVQANKHCVKKLSPGFTFTFCQK